MKRLAALGLLILALIACTDSDEYLFNEQSTQEIKVSAIVTRSFDSDTKKANADTIQPGDSLIFMTTVYPSKSIRNKQYYWTIDGKSFASEYSFKKSIDTPGEHKVAFIFVDFFGDTLSDTLSITVATPPTVDTEHFIPANKTQNIATDTAINFAWNINDPDSLWEVYSHFILKNSENKVLVDTILQQAYFTYLKGLAPLQKYTWTVTAYNEFNQKSNEVLSSTFYTDGINGESSIRGSLGTSAEQGAFNFKVLLLDKSLDTLKSITTSKLNTADFDIKPLAKGRYNLIVTTDQESDFTPRLFQLDLNEGEVLELDSIILQDEIPPQIYGRWNRDTIDIADTLIFIVVDHGGELTTSKIHVYFENDYINNIQFSNDTLYVPFTKEVSTQSWSYKLITVIAVDQSYNRNRKSFYLRPNSTLPEVFSE